jgi:crossover junction endodeoxyribonuclease RuvC
LTKSYLGLDPGKSGGIGAITVDGDDVLVTAAPWPETEEDTWELISQHAGANAVLEKVHAMPKQGVSSTFTFGKHYGLLLGMLTAARCSYTLVPPRTWQKAMGALTGGDKNVSKRRAQQLFPGMKLTHATADALLMATYCRDVSP